MTFVQGTGRIQTAVVRRGGKGAQFLRGDSGMELFYRICIGISIGLGLGFLGGGIKVAAKKKYTPAQRQAQQRLIARAARVLQYLTFLLLALGLVWCVYFLVLGVVDPTRADYANNMGELIVGVLTVISIIFAFVEFLRRSDGSPPAEG